MRKTYILNLKFLLSKDEILNKKLKLQSSYNQLITYNDLFLTTEGKRPKLMMSNSALSFWQILGGMRLITALTGAFGNKYY